ncbi:MAG: DUF4291 domain-containing protein [Armatimonadota bacterium]
MQTKKRVSQANYEIRAKYDDYSIVVYQAFSDAIADAALASGMFVTPFSYNRMTWVKPSFLWLMERSNWGAKPGQERTLAIRICRSGWDEALALGVLTHPIPKIHKTVEDWNRLFEAATVHVQWDPERDLRGVTQSNYSIQVGISRHLIERYVNEWVLEITDLTADVRKMRNLIRAGRAGQAKSFLPPERIYPVSPETAKRIGMG